MKKIQNPSLTTITALCRRRKKEGKKGQKEKQVLLNFNKFSRLHALYLQ